jgi:hypothetical protein
MMRIYTTVSVFLVSFALPSQSKGEDEMVRQKRILCGVVYIYVDLCLTDVWSHYLIYQVRTLRGNVQRALRPQYPCTIVRVETQYAESALDNYSVRPTDEFKCALHSSDRKAAGRYYIDIEGVDAAQFFNITSGETTMEVEGAIIANGAYTAPAGASVRFGTGMTRRRLRESQGQRRVLVVRAETAGGNTISKKEDIVDAVFGTYGNTASMRSQYLGCSHDKLDLVPFEGQTENGYTVVGGIIEVSINEDYTGQTRYVAEEGLVNAAEFLVGDLEDQFDHLILCFPPGTTGGWVAYAYGKFNLILGPGAGLIVKNDSHPGGHPKVNTMLSAFNDQFCEKLSTLVHGTSCRSI